MEGFMSGLGFAVTENLGPDEILERFF